jgi:hypothetical protein
MLRLTRAGRALIHHRSSLRIALVGRAVDRAGNGRALTVPIRINR